MSEFWTFLLGVALTGLFSWLLTKTGNTGKYLAKVLSKVIKNPELQNKISNEIGVMSIKAGISIVEATPDNEKVEELLEEIKPLVEELESEVKK